MPGGKAGGTGGPFFRPDRHERIERHLRCSSISGGQCQFECGFEVVRPASGEAFANPGPGGFFRIAPGCQPVAHDMPARGGDGVDRPGRPFSHDEVADSAEWQTHSASSEPGGGVGPQACEESRPEERAAQDVAMDGRIFPPSGHVAIEFGGGDAVERGIGGQGLLGFHFERLALERCQLHTDDGEFADKVSLVIVRGPETVAQAVENPFESGTIGLGDEGIAFVPFDRAIIFEDVARFEAHQNHELFEFGVVIDIAASVHGISGRFRTDNAIKNDSLPSPIDTVMRNESGASTDSYHEFAGSRNWRIGPIHEITPVGPSGSIEFG